MRCARAGNRAARNAGLARRAWTTQEWLHFITRMTRPQPVARLQELDQRSSSRSRRNAEIAHAWYRLAIASAYPGLEPALERYLTGIGRLKPSGRCTRTCCVRLVCAVRTTRLCEARPGYHAITRGRSTGS